MCGIIAVVRRPGARLAPAADEVVGPLARRGRRARRATLPLAAACSAAADGGRVDRRAAARRRGRVGARPRPAPARRARGAVHARWRRGSRRSRPASTTAPTATPARPRPPRRRPARRRRPRGGQRRHGPAEGRGVGRPRDRLRTARAVADLAGPEPGWAAIEAYTSIQQALSAHRPARGARPRLGRASTCSSATTASTSTAPAVAGLLAGRAGDPLFRSGAVRTADGCLSLRLQGGGRDRRAGRQHPGAARRHPRRRRCCTRRSSPTTAPRSCSATPAGRSVGIISQPNAHPLNSDGGRATTAPVRHRRAQRRRRQLRRPQGRATGCASPPEITTDAKVIPTLVSRRLAERRATCARPSAARWPASTARSPSPRSAAPPPTSLLLALRGSGQALYVGLADDAYIVASEPYGVVEETAALPAHGRRDAGRPRQPDGQPGPDRGARRRPGRHARRHRAARLRRHAAAGRPTTTSPTAQITTRDIDRGDYPHFLLKEITESPAVVPQDAARQARRARRRPGRGRSAPRRCPTDAARRASLDGDDRPRPRHRPGHRRGRRPERCAAAPDALHGRTDLRVEALLATELSGFGLRADMTDTLVVAISQSGTTTDTNRTVDLVRLAGRTVVVASSTGAAATSPTSPTACSTRPTGATSR